MDVGLMAVLMRRREGTPLPSTFHRGQGSICFSTTWLEESWGSGGVVSSSMFNCSLIPLNPYFDRHLNALFQQRAACFSFIQSQVFG